MYKKYSGFEPRDFQCDCQLDIFTFSLSPKFFLKKRTLREVLEEFQSRLQIRTPRFQKWSLVDDFGNGRQINWFYILSLLLSFTFLCSHSKEISLEWLIFLFFIKCWEGTYWGKTYPWSIQNEKKKNLQPLDEPWWDQSLFWHTNSESYQ